MTFLAIVNEIDQILTIVLVGGIFLFFLIGVMWVSWFENPRQENEADVWFKENREIANSEMNLIKRINEFGDLIGSCRKCGDSEFQVWEETNVGLRIRCLSCKKKYDFHCNDFPILKEVLAQAKLFYVQLKIISDKHGHIISERLIKRLQKDYFSLRRNTPYLRAIYFKTNPEIVSEIPKRTIQRNYRRIPQRVKDKVWNRDKGRCVQCGSNERLEFDHIIPFSKGGANTYRNIQLLCEGCNRKKSDLIG